MVKFETFYHVVRYLFNGVSFFICKRSAIGRFKRDSHVPIRSRIIFILHLDNASVSVIERDLIRSSSIDSVESPIRFVFIIEELLLWAACKRPSRNWTIISGIVVSVLSDHVFLIANCVLRNNFTECFFLFFSLQIAAIDMINFFFCPHV
ncbi:Uncharacterised protein [Chlamydia trachomatis]|nr:Uncharacterised protein [Chlamydia trachomatis]